MKRSLGLAVAAALTLAVFAPASAQTDSMVIEFTAPPSYSVTERVVVFVGETPCVEADFGSTSTPTVVVGTDDQPTMCRVDGADVTFLLIGPLHGPSGGPSGGSELFNRTTYAGGTTFAFTNWAPMPAVDPAPPGGTLPAYMRAYVEADPTLQFMPMTIEFSNVGDAGAIDRLIVFVNTTVCATAEFGSGARPPLILGHESQPAGCHTDGGSVTFLQIYQSGQAAQLSVETTLVPGGTYELANWAPQPPGTPLPDYMQAFLDAGAGVKPSAGGNLGLAASEGAPQVALLLLGTLVLLAASRRVTAGRPD